jgi:hypothetical protein
MRTILSATSWATKRSIELLEAVEADLVQSCEAARFLSVGLVLPTKGEFRTTHAQ